MEAFCDSCGRSDSSRLSLITATLFVAPLFDQPIYALAVGVMAAVSYSWRCRFLARQAPLAAEIL